MSFYLHLMACQTGKFMYIRYYILRIKIVIYYYVKFVKKKITHFSFYTM